MIHDHSIRTLEGEPADLTQYKGRALLAVNVASKCGLTPQYEGLQKIYERYADRGFSVLGFPCNQFLEQEPGTATEIRCFVSDSYGVTFPIFEKIDVNGDARHPIYAELTEHPDDEGQAGDVQWNFEKFLISPGGEVMRRFRPQVEPEDPALVAAIEDLLPG